MVIKYLTNPTFLVSKTALIQAEDQTDSNEPPASNNISDSDRSENLDEPYPTAPYQEQSIRDDHTHQLSSLELENKLLKNEVASLNQEMSSALSRARKAQEGRYNIPS